MSSLSSAFCLALAAGIVALAPGEARAQPAASFFIEADLVRGDQEGAPGPFCVLNSQFKRLEKVVWRLRIRDQSGKELDDKALKSIVVELPDGQKMSARYSPHPAPRVGPVSDHFWTSRWIIPTEYPSGTFAYKVVVTGMDGAAMTWEPFKVKPSQLTVVAGQIEIKKP